MSAYELLGVSPDASPDELRLAYRRACRLHHPDRGGNPDVFDAVQKAWAVVSKTKCSECGGSGRVKVRNGAFTKTINCPTCWKTEGATVPNV